MKRMKSIVIPFAALAGLSVAVWKLITRRRRSNRFAPVDESEPTVMPYAPTAETRAEEKRESGIVAGADRPPTPEEEHAAEGAAPNAAAERSVAEHFEEMIELGAEVKGEGQVS